jgi:hypothetical protein
MMDSIVKVLSGIIDWPLRRATRGPVARVVEARRSSGEDDPALHIVVKVENPQGENAFVSDFVVEMLEPFSAPAFRYEYRSDPRTRISALGFNIPGHGISESVIVLAFFDHRLPLAVGCRARIAAVGRAGFRRRWKEFDCRAITQGD